jgi:phosphoesterase RecJ-like protein
VALLAERLGAASEIVSADGIPPAFDFLPRVAEARHRPTLEPDVAVICDAATLSRVGRIAEEERDWFAAATVVNVDHHVSSDGFGDLNLVDPAAAATCEVLLRVVDGLGIPLDPPLATALLTGVVRDSQGFSTPSTTSATLQAAARLVDAGAPLALVHRRVISELPYATLALWGRMLSRIGRAEDGRIVYTVLDESMLAETGTRQHDADGLAEFLASAEGARVTLLLRELGPTATRVSIRTADGVDATRIAGRFGGGGHAGRAGCTIERPLADSLADVIAASREVLSADGG